MFDLDAYLERIGLSGSPTVEQVHRAHCTSIPFESLDPLMGLPVSLDPGDIFEKLVRSGRGGYCFEHNLLLAGALRALGAEVDLHLARVLRGGRPEVPRARSHLLLAVTIEDSKLLADVGFGSGTSRFVSGFLVGRQWLDGRRLVLCDWGELCLTDSTAEHSTVVPVMREQIPELLSERFELPGFALDEDGRLTRASDGAR
jgi:N-acetyltransferase